MIYSNEYFDRKKFQDIIVNDIYIKRKLDR